MIVESERHLHESHRTLRDALFCGVSVPGTSCLATIASSLRDISQQALAKLASIPGRRFQFHVAPRWVSDRTNGRLLALESL
jgi:hypothetical protein